MGSCMYLYIHVFRCFMLYVYRYVFIHGLRYLVMYVCSYVLVPVVIYLNMYGYSPVFVSYFSFFSSLFLAALHVLVVFL